MKKFRIMRNNKTEIVPAIIAKDIDELKDKISQVDSWVDWIQIDVMDGAFVDNTTWNRPSELNQIKTSARLDAHLMISRPEETLDDWIKSGVSRITLHRESTQKHKEIIKNIKENDLEAGLALNPDTPIEAVYDFAFDLDMLLIMTVEPGHGGQELLEEALSKVTRTRQEFPDLKIGVDGGVNKENAPKLIKAGADVLVSGSTVFNSDNKEKIIKELQWSTYDVEH